MGFKTDTSFLRFLTMGAVGVRATMDAMRQCGFQPVELERYCTTNKIWMTKVKRLRLPDLLCVKTGVRVEVRAKSDLKVRMSDAPTNPDRRWDVGLRDEDLVAFVACNADDVKVEPVGNPIFFSISDLRTSIDSTKLGPPKSASEGAERDREWPTTVPNQDGVVLKVDSDSILTRQASGRHQTYKLKGKQAYVSAGARFIGGASIIAGMIPGLASLPGVLSLRWEPLDSLKAPEPVDRYAAAKAAPFAAGKDAFKIDRLLSSVGQEDDPRVTLEMAASAARLGSRSGFEKVIEGVWNNERTDLRMEAVIILTELKTEQAAEELSRIATAKEFSGVEIRQAAVWGLGRAGCRDYSKLKSFIADADEGVALHAIGAFDSDVPQAVIDDLIMMLVAGNERERAAASEALRMIGSEDVLASLAAVARSGKAISPWVIATIGRLSAARVRMALAGDSLLQQVEPMLTISPEENWLSRASLPGDLSFLLMQNLF